MTLRGHRLGTTATALVAVAVVVASLVPILYLFASGVSVHDIARQFTYPGTLSALWQTLGLTVLISALCLGLGVGCALLVVRTTLPAPRLFTVLFAVPLAVPGFVTAYADYAMELTYAPHLGLTTSFGGAALIMALTLFPYVFLPSVIALRSVDPAHEDIVASLRSRRGAVLTSVVLPALRPAVAGGTIIVALHVLAEYGAMVQLGRSTFTTLIMGEMLDYGDYRSARSLSLVLTVLSLGALVATGLISGRGARQQVARGAARPPRRWSLGRAGWAVAAAALVVPLAAVGPSVVMTLRGLVRTGRSAPLAWGQLVGALGSTLGYAVAAALVASLAALPISWWVTRRPSPASVVAERSVWVGHAIPSAILALSLVFLATRLVPGLYKTSVVLVAAYVILFLPLAIANQRVGLGATRQVYDDVAASLGVGPLRTFWRVSLPVAMPGFLSGALLVGLDASKELTATLMLVPYNVQTLSTGLWATTNGESLDFTAAAPYAAMLVLLGMPPVYLLVRQTLRHIDLGRHRVSRPAPQATLEPAMLPD